jgi:hypothetical protein
MVATVKFFNNYVAPSSDRQLDLGTSSVQWDNLYVFTIIANTLTITSMTVTTLVATTGTITTLTATTSTLGNATATALETDALTVNEETNFMFYDNELIGHLDDAVFA